MGKTRVCETGKQGSSPCYHPTRNMETYLSTYKTKQVIVMRTDLNMRKGKMCAQSAHAAMAFLTNKLNFRASIAGLNMYKTLLTDVEDEWLRSSFAKICVGVGSEEELNAIATKAKEMNLECHMITDSGATEFHGVPTLTCCAIGPDYSDKIDAITGGIKLL